MQQPDNPEMALSQVKSQCIAGAISLFDAQEKAYQQLLQAAAQEIKKLQEENKQLKRKPSAKKKV